MLVLSGNDPELLALGLQRPWHPRKRRDGSPAFIAPQPLLARERVRYIGDPVALVVADTLDQAKDAAELIEIDYETLPAVPTIEAAIKAGAPAIWAQCPDNIAFLHELGDKAAVEKACATTAGRCAARCRSRMSCAGRLRRRFSASRRRNSALLPRMSAAALA
jgi:carbon-monoxide dehydrogenase large subunit